MPSPNAIDDDATPANPKMPSTPRRTSTPKRKPNGTPNGKNATRKAKAPNSTPARVKATGVKKAQPTLLGDFLLGRQSTARVRRKSLDLIKAEMKMASVSKVQQPGGVKDRVQKWQKSSAAAIIEDPLAPDEPAAASTEAAVEGIVVTEAMKIKGDQRKTSRQKSKDENGGQANRLKSKSTPKKRVVSDDHWMVSKSASKKRAEKKSKVGATLPKNFVHNNPTNLPLEKKIGDWAKLIENGEIADTTPEKGKETKKPSNPSLLDDDIRVYASRSPVDDNVQVKPSNLSTPADDGIRIIPIKEESTSKTRKHDIESGTSRARNERHVRSPDQNGSSREESPREEQDGAEEEAKRTPSSRRRRRRSHRKSSSPTESLVDVPVGKSAFSVLDLPLGADANAMRKPKLQRTGSLSAVPKVLKKVYNEGLKIMHDLNEPPPRIGVNQPPSIESWLNGTTDPFIDGSSSPAAMATPIKGPKMFLDRDQDKYPQTESEETQKTPSRTHRRASRSQKMDETSDTQSLRDVEPKSPELQHEPYSRKVPNQKENAAHIGSGLKRAPAKRTTSSPRMSPLKEVLVDAFKGESEMYMPNSSKSPPGGPRTPRTTGFSGSLRDMGSDPRKPSLESLRRSPRIPDISKFDKTEYDAEKLQTRRGLPRTGQNRLSTLASSETLTAMTSIPETGSELSQATITHATARTETSYAAPADSALSRHPSKNSVLKRRLTKHSDLISVLSLPDTAGPVRGKTIRSARSIRTPRNKLTTATVDDLFRELAIDECKYMRELRTLVDGVVPVLLTSVLSRSSSAIAAGLFDPSLGEKADTIVTKPIVDMGVALERLRSLHRRIPLKDTKSLIQWAYGAHKVYEDYLTAWRMGFQDIVVNLAPASSSASSSDDLNLLGELTRSITGGVIDTDGERVDVAFLLKRPLVRIKYLLRLFEGLAGCNQVGTQTQALARDVSQRFQASKERAQRRVSEEAARLEDQAANNIDASLARDPRTLNPLDDVQIDRTRQVVAMDEFTLDLYHSTGQSLNCRTEIILRDKPKDESDVGDLLICETDEIKRWLLFPPVTLDRVSSRRGDRTGEIVVMIRGCNEYSKWHELLTLKTDEDIIDYWSGLFSSEPRPGPTKLPVQALIDPSTMPRRMPTVKDFDVESLPARPPSPCESEHPMGTRVKRRDSKSKIPREPEYNTESQSCGSPSMFARFQNKFRSSPKAKDSLGISDQSPTLMKRNKAPSHSRGNSDTTDMHSQKVHEPETITGRKPSYDRPDSPDEALLPAKPILNNQRRPSTPSRELPYIPKRRGNTPPTSPPDSLIKDSFSSSPLKESMRPEDLDITPKKQRLPKPPVETDPYREDGAPPPPVHGVLNPVDAKQIPVLEPVAVKQKTRRSSSPLKHEYQPSVASDDESSSDVTASSDESYTDSSDYSDDESGSEFFEDSIATPPILKARQPPPEPSSSLSIASVAPPASASQVLHNIKPGQPVVKALKFVAQIYHWDDKGRWEKLHQDITSVVIMPGQVEVFVFNPAHSNSNDGTTQQSPGASVLIPNNDSMATRPLLAFDLTPWVPMRKSNATDVDVRSPPLPQSLLKPTSHVMFRSANTEECWALYNALNHSRSNNVRYQQLAQEALLNSYGHNAFDNATTGNHRRTWLFGRKKSYRAKARAPSETNESTSSFKSSFSTLLRGGIGFNIATSRIERQERIASGSGSLYGSSESASYGFTPSYTPSSPGSLATGNTISSGHIVNLGTANIKIRLHRFEGRGKWMDLSYCHLTVSPPPLGRRQASSLNNGLEKHVLITTKPKLVDKNKPEYGHQDPIGIMDVVLGSRCFRVEGKTGILINIWEDFMLKPTGGVSGTTRKWMMQMATEAERRWVFGLLGNGVL